MPIDRGIIDQQLQELGESARWWDQRELRDLPAVLDADERILALSRGKIGRPRFLHRSWLIAITDSRVLCLRSGRVTSWRQLEVNADQITRVALRVGPFRGRVLIEAAGRTTRMLVPRMEAYKLVNALSTLGVPGSDAFTGIAPTRMVRRVVDHVLALPAAALDPGAARRTRSAPVKVETDRRIQTLEDEIQELRRQVDFLEELLRDRQARLSAGERG